MRMVRWLIPLVATTIGFHELIALGQDPVPPLPKGAASDEGDFPDLGKLPPLERTLYLSARRGAQWLWQMNRADGLFVPGQIPALYRLLEEDLFLRQAGAACALASAARLTGAARYEMRAKQAALALLASTQTDPADPGCRYPAPPRGAAERLASAGLLVWMIHELPRPGDDLVKQSDELCLFLAKQQQAAGSFALAGEPDDEQAAAAGLALLGLLHSEPARPAAWKLDAARRALPYYRALWQKNREPRSTAWLASALATAYAGAKEKPFADAAYEMADWLCSLQIGSDPKNPAWQGGFAGSKSGRALSQSPGIESALLALALVDASLAARLAGDAERSGRYRQAAERGLQFATTLQYTPANTRHFAEWYQPQLLGAFFASPVDGNTRLDYAQYGVSAMLRYLEKLAESPIRKK
jgi:hypothetical protein